MIDMCRTRSHVVTLTFDEEQLALLCEALDQADTNMGVMAHHFRQAEHTHCEKLYEGKRQQLRSIRQLIEHNLPYQERKRN